MATICVPEHEMQDLLSQLAQRWVTQGVVPGTGIAEAEIAAFECQYGVLVPPDFRLYLRTLNGMAMEGASDHNNIAFPAFAPRDFASFTFPDQWKSGWNLGAESAEFDLAPDAQFFFCCTDWLIASAVVGVLFTAQYQTGTPVFAVFTSHRQPPQIAASFGEFLQHYLEYDDNRLIDYMSGPNLESQNLYPLYPPL